MTVTMEPVRVNLATLDDFDFLVQGDAEILMDVLFLQGDAKEF